MEKQELIAHLKRQSFSPFIIKAFEKVKRESFIPQNMKDYAYLDTALPIQEGQTISQPSMIAWMLQLLELEEIKNKKTKILEIGSGSGYVLALLSSILPKAEIMGLEIKKELIEQSKQKLSKNKNVMIFNKSGYLGFPEKSPFDRILVSASAQDEETILNLANQLENNGIIVAPVGHDLIKIKKTKKLEKIDFKNAVMFVPLVKE